jgi:hypothetical protein
MKRSTILILSICLMLIASVCTAANQHPEKWYQTIWCDDHNGTMEVVLPDGTRADCVTEKYAIEFDFGYKWAESIGQCLNYALQTSKRAGIVLIIEKPEDLKYWIRLNTIIQYHKLPIDAWKYPEGPETQVPPSQ